MANSKKETRGGTRANAGKKLKYGEELVFIQHRVPVSMREELNRYIKGKLEERRESLQHNEQ